MKTLLAITTLLAAVTTPVDAWIHPIPDYKKQFEDSDLVAIVFVWRVTDTGSTNRLKENSRLRFREMAVDMKIISPLKGQVTNSISCRLYRFPTETERNADLGEREAKWEYLKANPWESCLFIPKVHSHYLVYLKNLPDGSYRPVTGSSVHTILQLKTEFMTAADWDAQGKSPNVGTQDR